MLVVLRAFGTSAGGRLIFQYTTKRASPPKCGATGVRLQGVSLWLCRMSVQQRQRSDTVMAEEHRS